MNCSNCGSQNPEKMKYCNKCGQSLQVTPINESNLQKSSYCTKCGALNPEKMQFCNQCGQPLLVLSPDQNIQQKTWYCTYCGEVNPEDLRFCSKCGTPHQTFSPGELKSNKNRKPFPFVIAIGGGLVVVVGLIVGYGLWKGLFSIDSITEIFSNTTETATQINAPVPSQTYIPASTRTLTPSSSQTLEISTDGTQIRQTDGAVMINIPGGTFEMGSNKGDSDELPIHTVTLSSYWFDRTEVTNSMYALCVAAGECDLPNSFTSHNRGSYYRNSQYANYPVMNVTWIDAGSYCHWAGGRLPTEAEWEFAARGTDGRTYPWGNNEPNTSLANTDNRGGDTVEVGSYQRGASPFGVLDMSGNVWEWVNDRFADYTWEEVTDPLGPEGGRYRVIRGGSWHDYAYNQSATTRARVEPDIWQNDIGFRCAFSEP